MRSLVLSFALLAALGVGCADRLRGPAPSPAPSTTEAAFKSSTTTFGAAATSTAAATGTPAAPEPRRWDVTAIPWRQVKFQPSPGTWVYFHEGLKQFFLVAGAAPAPGTPDPVAAVIQNQLAVFYPVQSNAVSFPTWERFEFSMGQLACAEGDTEETLTICSDRATNVFRGKTLAGLPYTQFTLPAYRKKDKAPRGTRAYIIVRLGNASDHAVMLAVKPALSSAPALALARSLRLE